jgi:hypothetical protein
VITLIKSISFQDQSNNDIAVLDNIMTGVDGSATFGYGIEATSLEVNDKQKQQYLHTHTLDIRVLKGDTSTAQKIDVMADNQRNVKVSGVTPDGFIIWNQPVLIGRNEQFTNRIISRQIKMTIDTPIGYADGRLSVYAGDNALALYDILERQGNEYQDFVDYVVSQGGTVVADQSSVLDDLGPAGSASLICLCNAGKASSLYYYTDSEDTLNGFTQGSGVNGGVSGDVQYMTYLSATDDRITSDSILFPHEGIAVTASVYINSASSTSGAEITLTLAFLDSNSNEISTHTQTLDDQSAPLRISVSAISPANTRFIALYVGDFTSASVGDMWSFKQPMLSLGGRTQFSL